MQFSFRISVVAFLLWLIFTASASALQLGYSASIFFNESSLSIEYDKGEAKLLRQEKHSGHHLKLGFANNYLEYLTHSREYEFEEVEPFKIKVERTFFLVGLMRINRTYSYGLNGGFGKSLLKCSSGCESYTKSESSNILIYGGTFAIRITSGSHLSFTLLSFPSSEAQLYNASKDLFMKYDTGGSMFNLGFLFEF